MRKIRKEIISTMITAISVASIVCSSPSVVLAADISQPSESYIEADLAESENPIGTIDETLPEAGNLTDAIKTTLSEPDTPTDTIDITLSEPDNPTDAIDTTLSEPEYPNGTSTSEANHSEATPSGTGHLESEATSSETEHLKSEVPSSETEHLKSEVPSSKTEHLKSEVPSSKTGHLESETATEETVGATTVTICSDITATFDNKTGALVLDSEGGTLFSDWKYDWSNATGLSTSDIKSIKVGSGTVYLPKSSSAVFRELENLTGFDSAGFDTSAVTDMNSMFSNCTSLTDLDLSCFDTSKVTNMTFMFSNCTSLKSLDLTGFNTSKLQYTHYMFMGCGKLTDLDLSSFDMSNVTGMTGMFDGCTALQLLKTPKTNATEVTLAVSLYDEAGNEYLALPVAKKSITLKASDNPFLKATIETKSKSYTYMGWYRKPNPVVKLSNKTLVSGTDYELSYKDNKNVGTATVFAHGKGKYSGTISCNFQITESNITQGTARTKYQTYKYTGWARKPALILVVNGRTLVQGTDYTVWYSNNTKVGTATVGAVGKGNYIGKIQCTFKIVDNDEMVYVPVYRMYNHKTGEHFYTTDQSECYRAPMSGTWKLEGVAWYSPKKSGRPVYRVSNPNGGYEHHYTTSKGEKDWLVSLGWRDEGIGFYSVEKNGVPVYRHYHPIQRTGNHHYTKSKEESDYIVQNAGWLYEGIAFYAGDPTVIDWGYSQTNG